MCAQVSNKESRLPPHDARLQDLYIFFNLVLEFHTEAKLCFFTGKIPTGMDLCGWVPATTCLCETPGFAFSKKSHGGHPFESAPCNPTPFHFIWKMGPAKCTRDHTRL